MFFLTFSSVWSLSYFFYITYTTTILLVILYVIPVLSGSGKYSNNLSRNVSDMVNGYDILGVVSAPYFLASIISFLWVSHDLHKKKFLNLWSQEKKMRSFFLSFSWFVFLFFFSFIVWLITICGSSECNWLRKIRNLCHPWTVFIKL